MLPRSGTPRIYTVPQGTPFLEALARALLTGNLPVRGGPKPGPLDLVDTTLFLPTRRATRALQEAFLRVASGTAVLLPQIKAISQSSQDDDLVATVEDVGLGAALNLDRVITGLERQLVLTALVLRWSPTLAHEGQPGEAELAAGARTPAQAAKLAKELARLMDVLELQGVGADMIASLVPETYSEHWARTLKFLEIVTQFWPEHLGANNLTSPVNRRNQLMAAETARLRGGASSPVIVAGVTGTDPVATRLMAAVANLPNGAIVLPCLDQSLLDDGWAAIDDHPEHPQYGLKKLLTLLQAERVDVVTLPGVQQTTAQRARASLTSEAMRPATTTQTWHHFTANASSAEMAQALEGITILEAPAAEDEAEAIALILRHVAQALSETAALVTPDRRLARRVSVRLQSWGLRVEDAAGRPFANTLLGVFLDLVAHVMARRFESIAFVMLLKHALCRLGMERAQLHRGVHTLEIAVFRASTSGLDLEGVAAALEKAQDETWRHAAARRLTADDWQAAREVVQRVAKAYAPMAALFASSAPASLAVLVKAHIDAAEALAKEPRGGESEGSALWQGDAGEWATNVFSSLLDEEAAAPSMAAADYPEFYRTLVAEKSIRLVGATHPRLVIRDPFEARLQQPDVVILGSLNEGTWPQSADPGPWLNRPMRHTLGLPAPEERIGDAAHDFASLLGAGRVYLTRAAKIDGVPTVPSRWLLRLQALLAGLGQAPTPRPPWLAWAQARTAIVGQPRPVRAPAPCPLLRLRPRQLSVTTIETWIANPYAVFAERILGLKPLPALGSPPDAALRGQIIHEALGRFGRRYPDRMPEDIASALVGFAEEALVELTRSPRVAAFWAPRFARFATWFAQTEIARRAGVLKTIVEVDGKLVLPGPGGAFTLSARADRIDVGDGGIVITDYKSGANLEDLARRALAGEAPQLALEAAITDAGGFTHVGAGRVVALRYISASGGEPPGREFDLRTDDVGGLSSHARDGLVRLIAQFDCEATPYRALRRARFNYDFDAYAHLARVAEWSADMGEET